MAKKTKKVVKAFKKKKKLIRQVAQGIVYIQSSFNNVIMTLTDTSGNTLGWVTAGSLGFKGTNNVWEKCRRAGQKLFLKGDKCLSPKCPFTRRSYAPGQHGQVPRRLSEYGRQLREKQKPAQIYGISNQQFKNYYQHALRKKGMTDLALLRLLELRLDNIVFRLRLADSRRQARILVRDGHLEVNGKKVTFPSF